MGPRMSTELIFRLLSVVLLFSLAKSVPCQRSVEPNNVLFYQKGQGLSSHISDEQKTMFNSFLAAYGTGYNNIGGDLRQNSISGTNGCGENQLNNNNPQRSVEPNNVLFYQKGQGLSSQISDEQKTMFNSFLATFGAGYNTNYGGDLRKDSISATNGYGENKLNNNNNNNPHSFNYDEILKTFNDKERTLFSSFLSSSGLDRNNFDVEVGKIKLNKNAPSLNYDEIFKTFNDEQKTMMNAFSSSFGIGHSQFGKHSSTSQIGFGENKSNNNAYISSTDDVLKASNEENFKKFMESLFANFERRDNLLKTFKEEKTASSGSASTFQSGYNLFDRRLDSNSNQQNAMNNGVVSLGDKCCQNVYSMN